MKRGGILKKRAAVDKSWICEENMRKSHQRGAFYTLSHVRAHFFSRQEETS